MDNDKASARLRLLAALLATQAEERAAWSAALRGHLLDSDLWRAARTVMIFAPLSREPDLLPLFQTNTRLVFPAMEDDCIVPCNVPGEGCLVPGAFRFREPDRTICPQVPMEEIDLVLVPGLGFGRDGTRLGRGRGHYDRFLKSLPARAVRCGVCFQGQVSDSLPVESHDVTMHRLLTEGGLTDCGITSALPAPENGA